jgi:branched-chain amino acid transport system substrate-binding protein
MGVVSPGSPGMYEEQFSKALGPIANYCISNAPWFNPKTNMTKVVKSAFAKANPKENFVFHGTNVVYTYESILIAADAFKRAKSTDPKALAEAIRQTNITDRTVLGGPLKFNAKGQVEGNLSACTQNLNGEPRVVLPESAAEAKPVFPAPDYKKA